MAFIQIFLLVILAFAVDAHRWNNCDNTSPVRFEEIRLSPDPLRLNKGAGVTFGGKFKVNGDAGTQYTIRVTLKKKVWFWVTVKDRTRDIGCDRMKVYIGEAHCPLKNGEYTVKERNQILPDVKLPSFLKRGNYFIRADLRNKENNKRIACLEAYVKIA
ncbi:Ganglioside GM2 activator [Desmophyllum pertusum]|uniref:Ganglioside GM2 activator n=1 Tax=Desmophyllum pertusum TaxID=174260 RepID=A0A9W9YS31_9CNID|nr:Ganglioside GM2 activator [Desmophyllum pertusum]